MIKIFYTIFCRDFKESLSDGTKSWFTLSFFLLCLLTFPLSLGGSESILKEIATTSIWIAALFATLLSLDGMYKEDFENGILEQYFISKISLHIVVLAKCLNHWIFTGLPIIVLSPFCTFIFSESLEKSFKILFSLLLGTLLFTFIGSPISALTLGTKTRGPLLAFLTLPFYIPVIIFGISSTDNINANSLAEFYLLSSLLSLIIFSMPIMTVKILEFVLE